MSEELDNEIANLPDPPSPPPPPLPPPHPLVGNYDGTDEIDELDYAQLSPIPHASEGPNIPSTPPFASPGNDTFNTGINSPSPINHQPSQLQLINPFGSSSVSSSSLSSFNLESVNSTPSLLSKNNSLLIDNGGLSRTSTQTSQLPQSVQHAIQSVLKHPHLRNLEIKGLSPSCALPPELGQAGHLTRIALTRCGLSSVPSVLFGLYRLQELDFANNRLTELPDDISRLSRLRSLHLDGNALENLPYSLASLPNLQVLNLEGNQLLTLPEVIGSMTSIKSLFLANNFIADSNVHWPPLTKLVSIQLANNDLTSVPEAIAPHSGLTFLQLANNSITSLRPHVFTPLTRLSILNLFENSIKDFTDAHAQSLTSLRCLWLASNHLASVSESIGHHMTRLYSLSLHDNDLETLPSSLGQLRGLTELCLGSNRLHTLPSSTTALTALHRLDLSNNRLEKVPSQILSMSNLERLCLDRNYISSYLPARIFRATKLAVSIRSNLLPCTDENNPVLGGRLRQFLSVPDDRSVPSLMAQAASAMAPSLSPGFGKLLARLAPAEVIHYLENPVFRCTRCGVAKWIEPIRVIVYKRPPRLWHDRVPHVPLLHELCAPCFLARPKKWSIESHPRCVTWPGFAPVAEDDWYWDNPTDDQDQGATTTGDDALPDATPPADADNVPESPQSTGLTSDEEPGMIDDARSEWSSYSSDDYDYDPFGEGNGTINIMEEASLTNLHNPMTAGVSVDLASNDEAN